MMDTLAQEVASGVQCWCVPSHIHEHSKQLNVIKKLLFSFLNFLLISCPNYENCFPGLVICEV